MRPAPRRLRYHESLRVGRSLPGFFCPEEYTASGLLPIVGYNVVGVELYVPDLYTAPRVVNWHRGRCRGSSVHTRSVALGNVVNQHFTVKPAILALRAPINQHSDSCAGAFFSKTAQSFGPGSLINGVLQDKEKEHKVPGGSSRVNRNSPTLLLSNPIRAWRRRRRF